jgi:hypothetical protein
MPSIAYSGGATGLLNPAYAPLPLAPVVPVTAPAPYAAPPITGAAPAPGSASSPCSRCVFNGGTQNKAVIPTSGTSGSGYITPPMPALSLVKLGATTAPAHTPQELGAFLTAYGPALAVGGLVLLLLLLAAATRRSS